MIKSIKYFNENCIKNFEKLENDFLREPLKMAEYVMALTDELHNLGLKMIQESLELMDKMLQESLYRKEKWSVESHTEKQLITSLGSVIFNKTLFTNKKTGKSEYLIDRILGLEKHERMTEDAEAKMYEEAVQTSYRRGGIEASILSEVSKQTVKNKIHKLEFPENVVIRKDKKVVDYLYIDADEDHVSLQFREKKGDLRVIGENQKNNCLITKLVYVYEGIENESPKSKRHKLIEPYYFCRVCNGKDNDSFWDEIYKYLNDKYDLSKVKKIYLNSDGGSWIKAGMKRLEGITYVLDEYHIEKYLMKLTSHMLDSQSDARDELRYVIRKKTKTEFNELVDILETYLKDDTGMKRMEEARKYITSNWTAAKLRLRHKDGVKGCSAEGHVSHILSSRMSSRPMGWSVKGASKMAQMRAYYVNGGDMLELVRYQKRELPKAAGAEYNILSSVDIIRSEKNRHGQLGKYMETLKNTVPLDIKKKAYFQSHVWSL